MIKQLTRPTKLSQDNCILIYLLTEPSQYGSNVQQHGGQQYYAMPTSGVVGVVGERPPPLLYAHHAHTPHTPHTPHHANLMYAPAPQPPHVYLDMLKRDGQQHQEQKKEAQVGPQYRALQLLISVNLLGGLVKIILIQCIGLLSAIFNNQSLVKIWR